jgi:hypothetical protein
MVPDEEYPNATIVDFPDIFTRISQMKLNYQQATNAFHLVNTSFCAGSRWSFGRTQWVKGERGLCGSVLMAD